MDIDTYNEYLQAMTGQKMISGTELDKYDAEDPFADQILPAKHWSAELLGMVGKETQLSGDMMPWDNMREFRCRPAEMTVWTGYNSHYKSLLLSNVIINFLKNGKKCAIASLELSPVTTLSRMCQQAQGLKWMDMTQFAVMEFMSTVKDLGIYSEVGNLKTHRVYQLIHWAADNGFDHIVFDSLMKCGVRKDNDAESEFMNTLQNLAKNTGIHVHLVAHARKPEGADEARPPNRYSISGNADISNIPDNVIICHKNVKKMRMYQEAKTQGDEIGMQQALELYDVSVKVDKQRHHPWEKTSYLWLHPSGQFIGANKKRIKYVHKIEPIPTR